jgi:hypothetical protein
MVVGSNPIARSNILKSHHRFCVVEDRTVRHKSRSSAAASLSSLAQPLYASWGSAGVREVVQWCGGRQREWGGVKRGEDDARSSGLAGSDGKAGLQPPSSHSAPARARSRARWPASRSPGLLLRAVASVKETALCVAASVRRRG